MRWIILGVALILVCGIGWWQARSIDVTGDWQRLWQHYQAKFISADGRVIDPMRQAATTSEGQAYALFFALVADDRPLFDRVLAWTENNLAQGDLRQHLPAWLWGERADHTWGVLDVNDASDANLWLAYALLKAGRRWPDSRYEPLGLAVLALICRHDLWQSPRGRFYLLPGAQGFVLLDGRIVLNPSYWPAFQMQYLAEIDPAGPWHNLQHTAERKQITLMPKGFAPDWIAIDPATGQASPAPQGVMGGYDAIRVYLWQGMSAGLDAVGAGSTDYGLLQGMAHYLKDHPNPPEWVNTQTGQASGEGNLGFKAALIPYLNAVGNHHQAHVYLAEIHKEIRRTGLVSKDYYPNNLGLFALAYLMGTNTLARRFKG